MASTNTTFGASIVPAAQTDNVTRLQQPTLDSPAITPAVSREDLSIDSPDRHVPTHSPLYQNKLAYPSHTYSRSNLSIPNEKDLEAGVPLAPAADADNPFTSKVSVDVNKECKMWPSKQTLIQSKKEEQRKKRQDMALAGCWGPLKDRWSKFTKKQRLWMKIAIALLVVGAIVGIAVGISVAVDGGVYVGKNHTEQIPTGGGS